MTVGSRQLIQEVILAYPEPSFDGAGNEFFPLLYRLLQT